MCNQSQGFYSSGHEYKEEGEEDELELWSMRSVS